MLTKRLMDATTLAMTPDKGAHMSHTSIQKCFCVSFMSPENCFGKFSTHWSNGNVGKRTHMQTWTPPRSYPRMGGCWAKVAMGQRG